MQTQKRHKREREKEAEKKDEWEDFHENNENKFWSSLISFLFSFFWLVLISPEEEGESAEENWIFISSLS